MVSDRVSQEKLKKLLHVSKLKVGRMEQTTKHRGRVLNNESREVLGFVALRLALQTICSSGVKKFRK